MKPLSRTTIALALTLSGAAWISSTSQAQEAATVSLATRQPSVSVFAQGLDNPRGLKFGPDGYLYVAEGGTGGDFSTVGQCEQASGVGPYTGSRSGSGISRINANGYRETVADGFPSSQTSAASGSLVSGIADITFIGGTLYGLLAGAGCSHGVAGLPNGVVRLRKNGKRDLIADLSAFQMAHPTKVVEPADFEPDGSWYSMVDVEGDLYALEPNHGELDRITPRGRITRVADLSASQGRIVPTAMEFHDGAFYIGNLGTFPIVEGSARILKVKMNGHVEVAVTGLSIVTGVAFDRRGRMYVLENTTGNPFPTHGTGRVVRVKRNGTLEVLASGLTLPTAMTFSPSGDLYVSAFGFEFGPQAGQVVKIDMPPERDGHGDGPW